MKNKSIVKATIFVTISYGLSLIFRFANNLILTRLLVPEYFGLMTLANIFLQGLVLFSDIGLAPAIIRSSKSHDELYLNTAWTIQIFRGVILGLLATIIAIPASLFYEESILGKILPVLGSIFIFNGFNSIQLILCDRDFKQGLLSLVNLISQIISMAVMILLAYLTKSIWSLVIGNIVAAVCTLISSFLIPTSHKLRIKFDKSSAKEIVSFGKWVFISTASMFMASQFDKFFIGKKFPMAILGVYGIASMFADLPKQFFTVLKSKILFPVTNTFRDKSNIEIRNLLRKPRSQILIILATMVAVIAGFGDFIIIKLYDFRYHEAAWMLPLLVVGTWPYIVHSTNSSSLYVIGKPQFAAYGNIAKLAYMILIIPIVFRMFGIFGTVVAVALNDIPFYIIINIGLYRENMSEITRDLLLTLYLICLTAVLIAIRYALGFGIPGIG